MKKLCTLLLFVGLCIGAIAGPDKKGKTIDKYYLDLFKALCPYDEAVYEVKVIAEEDSIKLYTSNLRTGYPVSLETYKQYDDSAQVRWGTQLSYYDTGEIHRHQFIDSESGVDYVLVYNKSGIVEQQTIIDKFMGVSTFTTWYASGKKKSHTQSKNALLGREESVLTTWYENGNVLREQRSLNGKTQELKMYEETGELFLRIPLQQGDTLFLSQEGNSVSRKGAVNTGVVNLDGDSIKVSIYDLNGRLLSEENFMKYSPEDVVSWGKQKYYYTTTAQPVDSVMVFKGINGENLQENTYYQDGKLKSSSNVTFNNVMVPVKELRQYYPSGKLYRYQKHEGEKLLEGHMYDSEGNETLPFYEFK